MLDEDNGITDKDYFDLFETNPQGKAILNHLIACFYDIRSYTPDDSHSTAYREGHRHVIRFMLAKIMAAQESEESEESEES